MSAKKKILIVPSWYPHAANPTQGIFFQEQAELMADQYDVRVLTSLRHEGLSYAGQRGAASITTERGNVTVYRFLLNDLLWLPSKLRVRYILNQYLQAFKKIQTQDGWMPDMIHGHSTFFGGIYSYFLSRNTGVPYMITEHSPLDMDIHKVVAPFRYYALDAIRKANNMMAVSYSRRREIIWHLPNINPKTIGNLVDETFFTLQPKPVAAPFRLLLIAQLNAVKDHTTFFRTAQLLKATHGKNIVFDVIGFDGWKGNNEQHIRAMAAKFGVEDQCVFVGKVERQEMLGFFHRAHALILTSIAEGMPVSVLEALCTGTPVFSTRCGGAEEVVNATNGAIVELKDSEGLALHITKLINGETHYDAERMRHDIVHKYGRDAFRAALSQQYEFTITSGK